MKYGETLVWGIQRDIQIMKKRLEDFFFHLHFLELKLFLGCYVSGFESDIWIMTEAYLIKNFRFRSCQPACCVYILISVNFQSDLLMCEKMFGNKGFLVNKNFTFSISQTNQLQIQVLCL